MSYTYEQSSAVYAATSSSSNSSSYDDKPYNYGTDPCYKGPYISEKFVGPEKNAKPSPERFGPTSMPLKDWKEREEEKKKK